MYPRQANFFEEFCNICPNGPIEKSYLMAYLADIFDVKLYVEDHIDEGKIFFPMAAAVARNQGIAIEAKELNQDQVSIDMLHCSVSNVDSFLPFVKTSGIIILDKANEKIKNDFLTLFENQDFIILWKQEKTTGHLNRQAELAKKLKNLHVRFISRKSISEHTIVTVGILTYNHEKFILECLDSVYYQNGDFKIKILICDDHSTDNTIEIIENYVKTHTQRKNIEFVFVKNPKNLGLYKNFGQLVMLSKGCDYLAFCEGDDYWLDNNRILKHINFLNNNPECALSANALLIYYEEKKQFELFKPNSVGELFETLPLVNENFIGNLSAGFYDGRYLEQLPESLFDIETNDWFFNIYYSSFGDIGYLIRPLSVYRKHVQGSWSALSYLKHHRILISNINDYNRYSNFVYDQAFTHYQNLLLTKFDEDFTQNVDLAIIDDVFPHPLSGFRYQKFTTYYDYFDSIKILTNGASVRLLGKESIDDLIIDYKRRFPSTAGKLVKFDGWNPVGCKLLYFVFLGNAYTFLPIVENFSIPFVFELHAGGGFALNNADSDRKLKTIFKSPYFKKVIVTQKIIFDYLIKKRFCTPDKIVLVFGVVTPLEKLEKNYSKQHFGFEKNTLDICFVAHKYTPYGRDKGYDTFIAVAKKLNKKYSNINFHVVGPFDSNDIDVSEIQDRIHFYGTKSQEEFDIFYIDKDIILSPNRKDIIFKGSFDGFPTATCIDAGLRKTAIFATDELHQNVGYFKEDEEIVIIPQDVDAICNKIEYGYNHPNALKNICENGAMRIRDLYSFEKQLAPRIAVLKEEIAAPFYYEKPIRNSKKEFFKKTVKRFCPPFLRGPGRKLVTFIRTF